MVTISFDWNSRHEKPHIEQLPKGDKFKKCNGTYHEQNKERIREYQKQYQNQNKEYFVRYSKICKQRINQYYKQYYLEHKYEIKQKYIEKKKQSKVFKDVITN